MKMRCNLRRLLICKHMRFEFCLPPALLDFENGLMTKKFYHPASLEDRAFQKVLKRFPALRKRNAMTALAPFFVKNMPDCLQHWPITLRHPASTTPEPMNQPCLQNVPYCILSMLGDLFFDCSTKCQLVHQ